MRAICGITHCEEGSSTECLKVGGFKDLMGLISRGCVSRGLWLVEVGAQRSGCRHRRHGVTMRLIDGSQPGRSSW